MHADLGALGQTERLQRREARLLAALNAGTRELGLEAERYPAAIGVTLRNDARDQRLGDLTLRQDPKPGPTALPDCGDHGDAQEPKDGAEEEGGDQGCYDRLHPAMRRGSGAAERIACR